MVDIDSRTEGLLLLPGTVPDNKYSRIKTAFRHDYGFLRIALESYAEQP